MQRFPALLDGETGAYGVTFPGLPGCVAMGESIDDALSNAAEAIRDYVEVLVERGGEHPEARTPEAVSAEPEVKEALSAGASLVSVPLLRFSRPVKANLSIDSAILAQIDGAAERLKLTRSALIEQMAKLSLPLLP